MPRIVFFFIVLAVGGLRVAAVENQHQADFYVSPIGSDSWSGILEEPNAAGSDGPFASLARARDAVRELKKSKASDVVVLIRGGTYKLNKTVVFGLEDSGRGDSMITYAAYPEEKPVFTSGQEISGWTPVSGTLLGLSEAARGKVMEAKVSAQFFTLYDAEGLLPRARSEGFILPKGGSRTSFVFPEGKMKNWSNVTDVEVMVRPHHAWVANILPVASVDEKTRTVETSIEATYAMNRLHFLPKTENGWVENVVEELDEPGEWALNTEEGKVYLWPRAESPVYYPRLIEFILVEGEVDFDGPSDVPVKNLCFRGLTFTQGDRYSMEENDAGIQHDWDFMDKANALLRLRGTENCVIDKCHFTQSGSNAIRVDLHGQNTKITGNHIEYMGAGGIVIAGYGPGTKDVNKSNFIYNNHVHHTGRIYWHGAGILMWQTGENRVANNLVHNTPYTSIILCGCMTHFFTRNGRELGRTLRKDEIGKLPKDYGIEEIRPFLHSRNNIFEYNEIHHSMETMGDGNAFYIRGSGAGNIFRRNYIHDLVAPMIMQCAIRTDGGQHDTLFAENLIVRCASQGIMAKLNTRVENNIVVDVIEAHLDKVPPRANYLSLREAPTDGATIQRNVFYSTTTDATFISELKSKNDAAEDSRGRPVARSKEIDTDNNIYFCVADPSLAKNMLKKQQADGVDKNSKAVDPLFVDPANDDYRFRPDSPAVKMGILSIDVSKMGLLN